MEYKIKKLRDANGNLRDEIDPIRGRYSFSPITPTGPSDNFIEIPEGKVFYMDMIEVYNADTSSTGTHTFTVQDDDGNSISVKYVVPPGENKQIHFYHQGLTGKIHFVPDTPGKLVFKPSGYLDSKD